MCLFRSELVCLVNQIHVHILWIVANLLVRFAATNSTYYNNYYLCVLPHTSAIRQCVTNLGTCQLDQSVDYPPQTINNESYTSMCKPINNGTYPLAANEQNTVTHLDIETRVRIRCVFF